MSLSANGNKASGFANEAAATEAKYEGKADMEAFRRDLAALRQDVMSLIGNAKRFGEAKGKEGIDKGKGYADDAKSEVDEYREQFEDQVRRRPLASVAIALGAGIVIGALKAK